MSPHLRSRQLRRLTSRAQAGMVAALCLGFVVTSATQSRRLEPAYRSGRDAVRDGNYAAGIPLLLEAIKIAPRQERNKVFDGAFQGEYFPYYYLGVAYLRTRQYDRAEQAFNDAKTCRCLTDELRDLMAVYENDVRVEREKEEKAKSGRGTTPTPSGPDPNFVRQLGEAETAMGSRRFADAIRIFEALRRLDGAEYGKRNLGARRDEAARALADDLVRQGNQLLQASQLTAARAKFQEANGVVPGSGQRGLDEIVGRQQQYAKLKTGADADLKANRPQAAMEKLKLAEGADPEQYERDGLAARVQELTQQLQGGSSQKVRDFLRRAQERVAARDYAAAIGFFGQALNADPNNAEAKSWLSANAEFQRHRDTGTSQYKAGQLSEALESLENARRQDAVRFAHEKLDAIVGEINRRLGGLPEEQAAPVRQALIAYLRGDADRARTELEAIAARDTALDPRVRSHVFAWLSVAYADLAITARAEADRAELRAKAIERFNQLLSAEPGYQLRDSLISPQILQLLKQGQIKRQ